MNKYPGIDYRGVNKYGQHVYRANFYPKQGGRRIWKTIHLDRKSMEEAHREKERISGDIRIRDVDLDRSSIYFLYNRLMKVIKIGVTKQSVHRRIKDYNQMYPPFTLRLLGICYGGTFEEWEIHNRFKEERKFGEWFEPTPRLLRFIKEKKDEYKAIRSKEMKNFFDKIL